MLFENLKIGPEAFIIFSGRPRNPAHDCLAPETNAIYPVIVQDVRLWYAQLKQQTENRK